MKNVYIPTSIITALILILKLFAVPAIPWGVVFLPLILATSILGITVVATIIIIFRYRDSSEKLFAELKDYVKSDE